MRPSRRENMAMLGVILAAIVIAAMLALVPAHASAPINLTCNKRAHYKAYEDGSGVLYCGKQRVVSVHVPW